MDMGMHTCAYASTDMCMDLGPETSTDMCADMHVEVVCTGMRPITAQHILAIRESRSMDVDVMLQSAGPATY